MVSEPAFLADLGDVSMGELRDRRRLCEELDGELSYYRRALHGRLDLLGFELRRRSGEETRSLIDALPEILSGDETTPREPMPKNLPIELPDTGENRRAIDAALADDFLTHLPAIADDDLRDIETHLAAMEREVSSQRKAVHQALDAILEELTRRYRDGSASVDELLEQA